jgi:hypothetical protein
MNGGYAVLENRMFHTLRVYEIVGDDVEKISVVLAVFFF